MSWFYSINGGGFESSNKETLQSFLENVADGADSPIYIKTLSLHFTDGQTDGYQLPIFAAQKYLDALVRENEEIEHSYQIYGTYEQQVRSYYNSTRV